MTTTDPTGHGPIPEDLTLSCGCQLLCAMDESGQRVMMYNATGCHESDGVNCTSLAMFAALAEASGKTVEIRFQKEQA